MGDKKYDDPIKQILSLGTPYPMVVLPVDGEFWVEGTCHTLSRDINKRPLYPSIDIARCTLDEDANVYNYRRNFSGKEHINYAGEDKQHGPILMSVLLDHSVDDDICDHYIVILRTKCKTMFKAIPCNLLSNEVGPRELMRYILGAEPLVDRFHPIALPRVSDHVLRFDEHTATTCHKVGVLYQTFGQIHEEDYLQNQEISPAFKEFMELIGEKVTLKDFPNYCGGLDVKYGQTGQYSYYTNYKDREIMFHVSPVLPYASNDPQQLSRKRHIGNDIVTIIFQEENTPFCPSSIRSHVLHVFIVIQVENPNTEDTYYKISVTAKEGVPKFAPSLPIPCIFKKGPEFRNFLLSKVLNGEIASLKCDKFSALGERTRSSLLEQIVNELILKSETLLENGHLVDDTDSPQKGGSFLSTFRSALRRNGRTGTNIASSSESSLKNAKNLGQSLSLNDLTLMSLEVEDGKKDIKINSKEKKVKKKSNLANNMLKSQVTLVSDHILSTCPDLSPSVRPRSMIHVDQSRLDQSQLQQHDLPRINSCPTNATSSSTSIVNKVSIQNGYDFRHFSRSYSSGGIESETGETSAQNSLRLVSAYAEIDRLKAEVNKLQLDKMDLIRQNVIHQREVKKLHESLASTNRREKRKSAIVVTSTEFV